MSDTTIINSKAIQSLLAHSETQLGQPASGASTQAGASFHQLLEKAVNDDAHGPTSLTARSPSGAATERFRSALTGAVARHQEAAPASTRAPKTADTGLGGAGGPASPARGTLKAGAPGAKPDALPGTDADDDSPALDVAQLKVVNAPALPERPPSTARDLGQQAQTRGQADGTPKASSSVGNQESGVAGAASPAIGGGARGFAAVLASAHASASVPTSLVDQASFDPTLRMNVTPQAAQLSMDTGAAGALTAQLQITNGVADVHLTGEAAAVLAKHGAELSLGLTAAGLQPGRVEITPSAAAADLQSATSDGSGGGSFPGEAGARDDSSSQPQQQNGRDAKASPAPASTLSARASRVHVKA
jgi:hypothetical protein